MRKLSDIPESERPREKLRAKGVEALSDVELLAVMLGKGTHAVDVMTLADRVVKALARNKESADLDELEKIEGVGPTRAMVIAAALEFARRRIRPEGIKVTFPTDVLPLIRHYADRKQEHFICISLNGAGEVIASRVVAVGLVNRTQVHPREVFADAITDRAAAVVIAHNHPSGGVTPSKEDIELTNRLRTAGETLGIKVLDHVVFDAKGHCSLMESNL